MEQAEIGFTVNGVEYTVTESCRTPGEFFWSNGDEESKWFYPSMLEAQQAAIVWESDRRERARQAREDEQHARWQEQHNNSLRAPL